MSTIKIDKNSTLHNLTGELKQRERYVKELLGNFHKLGPNKEKFVLRLGVQGKGHSPHYRFEYSDTIESNNQHAGLVQGTHKIYNGLNHEEMTAFDTTNMIEHNWSLETMNFAEVKEYFDNIC